MSISGANWRARRLVVSSIPNMSLYFPRPVSRWPQLGRNKCSDPHFAAARSRSAVPLPPPEAGLVKSFNRPGGNVTGSVVLTETLEPKRLELLHEIVPGITLFGALVNPTYPAAADQLRDLEAAIPKVGRRLLAATASNDDELTKAFVTITRAGVGALVVTSDPFFDTRRQRIIEFAAQSKLPAIYQFREYAYEGGLISYGPSITDAYRQVGIYTARILKGDKPSELPVLLPTKFDFVVNLKTAKALGLDLPPTLVARADEVIE
jgi:putative tryptophan/tyrosine transport system substrate-binding protein